MLTHAKPAKTPQLNNFLIFFAAFSGVLILTASPDQRLVILPVSAAVLICGVLFFYLWSKSGNVPIFDIGMITALATLFYSIIPPLQFLFSGMQHTILSAVQLYSLHPTPAEMGSFTWFYTVYLASLTLGYIWQPIPTEICQAIPIYDPIITRIMFWLYLGMFCFVYAVKIVYGVDPYIVYDPDLMNQAYEAMKAMPLILQQIYNSIFGMFFIVKLGLMLALILNWGKPVYRYIFYVWLLAMLIGYIIKMGARTELVLTYFAAIIMYHRFVRQIAIRSLVIAGTLFFTGFILFGSMRGQATFNANIESLQTFEEHKEIIFSLATEFQTLFAGTYDLLWMKNNGIIQSIPLQFRMFDIVMLIPQQLLPFDKIDVQNWYVDNSLNAGYFMYNPIAQSILGFGWPELVVRGMALGLSLGWLRRWHLKNSTDYLKTLLYIWLIVVSYYTIRSTAFYILASFIIYRFLPFYLLISYMTKRKRESILRHQYPASIASPK